jgi:hypothetical protein
VVTVLASRRYRFDGVARFPGGTVHVRGVSRIDPNSTVPIVGGTGLYAGATGVVESRELPNGYELDTYRLQIR